MIERVRLLTLGEFIQRCVEEHGCKLLEGEPLMGPRGRETVRYLCRMNGRQYQAVLPKLNDDDHLDAEVLASLCKRLGLAAFDFGLLIG